MANFEWTRRPSVAWNIRRYVVTLRDAVWDMLWYYAPLIEAEMKETAPWTDRTSNARQTLAAFVYEEKPLLLVLVAKQHMVYGKYLELRNGGKYAVVGPTLTRYYAPVWDRVRQVVE